MTEPADFTRRRAEQALRDRYGTHPHLTVQLSMLDELGWEAIPRVVEAWDNNNLDTMFGFLHYDLVRKNPGRHPEPDLALFTAGPRPTDSLGDLWDQCHTMWPDRSQREPVEPDPDRLERTTQILRDLDPEFWPTLILTFVVVPRSISLLGWRSPAWPD